MIAKHTISVVFTIIFFIGATLGSALAQSAPLAGTRYKDIMFSNVSIQEGVNYGSNKNDKGQTVQLKMDVYTPEDDTVTNRPVMILAFGGGFIGGTRDGDPRLVAVAEDFAKRGYVVASIDYRLASTLSFNPDELLKTLFRAMHDMKAAVRFFRADAAGTNKYGVSGKHIFAGGASSGAITAALAGSFNNGDLISPGAQAFLTANGGVDGNSGGGPKTFSSEIQGIFSVSGAVVFKSWIDSKTAPIYAAHEEFDPTVPCRSSSFSALGIGLAGGCDMVDAAISAGVPAKLRLKEGAISHVAYSISEILDISAEGADFIYENVLKQTMEASGLFASVLPGARSVKTGDAATAFATISNTNSQLAQNCSIALPTSSTIQADFQYQTTNAANQPTGTVDTPTNIAAGSNQGFVFAITPTQNITQGKDIELVFDCANTAPVTTLVGLNTLLLSSASTQPVDMISIADTVAKNGIVDISGNNGSGFFVAATVNNNGPSAQVTASVDTGNTTLPVSFTLCRTNATGVCLNPPASSVPFTAATNQANTFTVFVKGSGNIPLDPANNRAFLRFKQGSITRGATSVAIQTK